MALGGMNVDDFLNSYTVPVSILYECFSPFFEFSTLFKLCNLLIKLPLVSEPAEYWISMAELVEWRLNFRFGDHPCSRLLNCCLNAERASLVRCFALRFRSFFQCSVRIQMTKLSEEILPFWNNFKSNYVLGTYSIEDELGYFEHMQYIIWDIFDLNKNWRKKAET